MSGDRASGRRAPARAHAEESHWIVWGEIAYRAVEDSPREDWADLTDDLLARCEREGIRVPHTAAELLELAYKYDGLLKIVGEVNRERRHGEAR